MKVGIDPRRIEMFNLSAAMGPRWAEICTDFTERVRQMGPSPVWYGLQKLNEARRSETIG